MNSINQSENAIICEKIKNARILSKLTQSEVASKIGIARTTLIAIEKGDRIIKNEELIKLSDLYQIELNTLLRPSSIIPNLEVQFRRKHSKDDKESQSAFLQLQKLAGAYIEVENLLNKKLITKYPKEIQIYSNDILIQAEDLSFEIRSILGLGISPILDLVRILETEIGIRIFFRALDSNISGCFAYSEEIGACILVNSLHSVTRQNFTVCHEFAHFLTNRNSVSIWTEDYQSKGIEEKFADTFASAFLMPATSVRKKYTEIKNQDNKFSSKHIMYMADIYGVSPQAMCLRLENLELLKKGTWEALQINKIDFSLKSIKEILNKDENYLESKKMPERLDRFTFLVFEAYELGYYTESQVVDLLELDPIVVRAIFQAFDQQHIEF